MMSFVVTVKDPSGRTDTLVREGSSRQEVIASLKAEGMLVISVRQSASRPRTRSGFFFSRTGSFEVEMSLRQASSMLKSGITLSSALQTLSEQALSRRSSKIWMQVGQDVYSGVSFARSLSKHRSFFDEMVVSLCEVGERTGELEKALLKAAEQLETRRSIRSAVVNALMYPAVAVVMSIAVAVYLVVCVIPKLGEFLRSGGGVLPPVTRFLMDFSDFTTENGVYMIGGMAAAVLLWHAVRLSRAGRELQDAFLMRIPVTGRILRLSGTALFSRSMQIMIESGVTLTDSLQVCAGLLGNRRLRRRVEQARDCVIRGMTLEKSLSPAVEFMPMLGSMAAVGERSGSLPDAFGETARFHELLLSLAVKRFGMFIEPVMIVITGGIVGFVYIAFFMALFAIAGIN